jgi:hypothetical protein
MPTSYTSLLGLALPVTGELSGTWGDTVNDYITRYVDASVAGTQAISGSQTAVTLTVTNGTTLTQVGSGSSGSAQYAVINCTGNPAGLLTITAPASSRQYLIINATSTSQSVKIVGAGPTTGVTLVTGESAIVAWNGSDYVKVASSAADGVTTFSAGTTGFTPSTATSGAVTLGGTLATTNGGTGLTSFTSGGVVYASSSSALATGSALTFNGTKLGINKTPSAGTPQLLQIKQPDAVYSGISIEKSDDDSYLGIGYWSGNSAWTFQPTYQSTGSYLPIAFATSGTERMRLDSSGNLGIGTSTPSYKLDVVQDANSFTGQRIRNNDTGSSAYAGLILNANGNTWAMRMGSGAANSNALQIAVDALGTPTVRATLDTSGNLGLGVTPSAWNSSQWSVFEGAYGGALAFYKASNVPVTVLTSNAYNDGSWKYKTTDPALQYEMDGNVGIHKWYTAPSGTAGNAISFTQAMTLTAAGDLGVGTTSPSSRLEVRFTTNSYLFTTNSGDNNTGIRFSNTGRDYGIFVDGGSGASNGLRFYDFTAATERARITAAGFTQPVAYADTVVALGNTGTATTINLQSGNVFTATLTGNCTFTLSNPIATGSSSFTLILTNDGTAGRTVAWSGGSFVFPGGAAALSRTTTANAVDVWVFFTPNGGTTWYGNIAMKDMKA